VVVATGTALICLITGLGTGIAAAGVTGDRALIGNVLAAHLGFLPAIFLVIAVCAALYGWAPRILALLGWALVVLAAVVTFFADLLDLPTWLVWLSPFSHLAQLPVEKFAIAPVLTLFVLAAAATLAGLTGFQRRQINVV